MLDAMAHRGPDGDHRWFADGVTLGARRLAIVDVVHGTQPLSNETGTVQVVFNGEIYNHRRLRRELAGRGHQLGSGTDGAVIPHLYEDYGSSLFERLEGMFAIGLWDTTSRTLLLARDPRGIKPLYVWQRDDELRFASEIKGILADPSVPRELDPVGLDHHLTFRFTPAPRTLLRGVAKLEPGTMLRWRKGPAKLERYARSHPPPFTSLTFAEAAEEFLARLRSAVHSQMMSDRPIGAMLSGGIDSASIVALMAERSSTVKTFTVGFEGGGSDADETALARRTASVFGTEHHELVLERSDFTEQLPGVLEMLEEPVATSSAVGFLAVARLAAPEVPVLLSGQGADELLGGYWRYVGESLAGRRGATTGARLLSRWRSSLRSPRLERGLRALAEQDALRRFMQTYAVFTEAQKRELYAGMMAELSGEDAAEPVERLRREVAARTPLEQMMYVDLRVWLPDDLLLVGDKMTMAASVEMRVPFLDSRLVDLAESLPGSHKVRHGRRKAVAKAALSGVLPREVIRRKERGFATPVGNWLRAEMLPYARELLLGNDAWSSDLFKRSAIDLLLRRHQEGEFDHTRQIFCLLSLELWGRQFLGARHR